VGLLLRGGYGREEDGDGKRGDRRGEDGDGKRGKERGREGSVVESKKSLKLTLDCAFGTVCSVTQPFCLSFCVWNYCKSNQPT